LPVKAHNAEMAWHSGVISGVMSMGTPQWIEAGFAFA